MACWRVDWLTLLTTGGASHTGAEGVSVVVFGEDERALDAAAGRRAGSVHANMNTPIVPRYYYDADGLEGAPVAGKPSGSMRKDERMRIERRGARSMQRGGSVRADVDIKAHACTAPGRPTVPPPPHPSHDLRRRLLRG